MYGPRGWHEFAQVNSQAILHAQVHRTTGAAVVNNLNSKGVLDFRVGWAQVDRAQHRCRKEEKCDGILAEMLSRGAENLILYVVCYRCWVAPFHFLDSSKIRAKNIELEFQVDRLKAACGTGVFYITYVVSVKPVILFMKFAAHFPFIFPNTGKAYLALLHIHGSRLLSQAYILVVFISE